MTDHIYIKAISFCFFVRNCDAKSTCEPTVKSAFWAERNSHKVIEKVLATDSGHDIIGVFRDEAEYQRYCSLVVSQCMDIALSNLSLDELIKLWKNRNMNR